MFEYERFSQLCDEKGIKKSFLYEKVGQRADYNSNLKRTKNVDPKYVEVWANILETTPEYLEGKSSQKENVKIDSELMDLYNCLTTQEQEQLKERIREYLIGCGKLLRESRNEK